MAEESNEISEDEDANFEDGSDHPGTDDCVAEEMADSYYIYQD